jgi:hypothetical protein
MTARGGLRFVNYNKRHNPVNATVDGNRPTMAPRRQLVVRPTLTERQYLLYSRCSKALVQLRGSRVEALGTVNSVYGK